MAVQALSRRVRSTSSSKHCYRPSWACNEACGSRRVQRDSGRETADWLPDGQVKRGQTRMPGGVAGEVLLP
jgi:hypothetical protein